MTFGRFRQATPPSEAISPLTNQEKPVVLIVDDDARIREGLQAELQKTYAVRLGANGEEGLRAVDEQVKAVILDIKMPGKDGFQVYTDIKTRFPDLPIIFYSAYQDILEAAKLSMKYSPFNFFDKGGDPRDLLKALKSAVQYYTNIQKLREIQ